MSEKERVLFVGEHPFSFSGNGNMFNALLRQINIDKYEICCFITGEADPMMYDAFDGFGGVSFIPARNGSDIWGIQHLIRFLQHQKISKMVTIGVDIWRFAPMMNELYNVLKEKNITWISIMPYDSASIIDDWVTWMGAVDCPYVYSKYGYSQLKGKVRNINYFRPPLFAVESFFPRTKSQVQEFWQNHFRSFDPEGFVFGFVGRNQYRKEPNKVMEAYVRTCKYFEGKRNVYLYLHTDLNAPGAFNLEQLGLQLGAKTGFVMSKQQNANYFPDHMPLIYNSIDCLVLPSLQEGLSWTVLEAMLCKTPVIASDSTAHKELLKGCKTLVPMNDSSFVRTVTSKGPNSHIPCPAVSVDDLTKYMIKMVENRQYRESAAERGFKNAQEWLEGVGNINTILERATKAGPEVVVFEKEEAILFAQHSSAGDVLMTTKALKGLKERHSDLPLHYMTMPQYKDILVGNPYIDKIVDWDERLLKNKYKFVYNPHGDKILPGHWGRNSNSILSDFYWKILMVEKGDFFIDQKQPKLERIPCNSTLYTSITNNSLASINIFKENNFCVVHTTGGDPEFRTYKYMKDVCRGLSEKYMTVQLGGANDYPAGADLDLRGRLTFNETAWVMARASLAVTVDSFISHLAGMYGVNQVCLFGSGNANVVKPDQVRGVLKCLSPDYISVCPGLGPCSASVRTCPVKCTGTHSPQDILNAISEIEEEFALILKDIELSVKEKGKEIQSRREENK